MTHTDEWASTSTQSQVKQHGECLLRMLQVKKLKLSFPNIFKSRCTTLMSKCLRNVQVSSGVKELKLTAACTQWPAVCIHRCRNTFTICEIFFSVLLLSPYHWMCVLSRGWVYKSRAPTQPSFTNSRKVCVIISGCFWI